MIGQIGKMIRELREQRHITQTGLGREILSTPEVSRVENGEKEPDIFTLAVLLQRLGKSLGLFEILLSDKEYQLLELREKIQDYIRMGRYSEAVEHMAAYRNQAKGKKVLHNQYLCTMQAVLSFLRDRAPEDGLQKLKEALCMTMGQEELWITKALCLQEIQILLLMACLHYELGAEKEAVALVERVYTYVQNYYTSEDLKDSVCPKCEYLLEQMQKVQNLRFETETVVIKLLFLDTPQKAFLDSELIFRMRKAQGHTQDSLSSGVCARETLSNIEHGRESNPKKKKQLLDRIGVRQNKYYSYVAADSFEVYELLYSYEKSLLRNDSARMEQLLSELEKKLDKSIPENRQFLNMAKLIQGIRRRKIPKEEAVQKLEGMLKQTMPEYAGCVCRIPYREEFLLLLQLLLCLKELGSITKVVTICETLRRQYIESKVPVQCHGDELLFVYTIYVKLLEEYGLQENMENYKAEWISLKLKYRRGEMEKLSEEEK